MTKGHIFSFLLIAMLATALGIFLTNRMGPTPQAQAPVENASDHKDAEYEIDGETFTLTNGIAVSVGEVGTTTVRYFGNEAKGDLNDDGKEDIAFIVTVDTGGSGTFYYLTAALRTTTGYQGLNAIFLGDRISPQQTEIRQGVAIANFATRNPSESFAVAPSIGTSTYARAENGTLIQVAGLGE